MPFSDNERRVLAAARQIETCQLGFWGADNIKRVGWPNEAVETDCEDLGINYAIRSLIRRGRARRVKGVCGGYRLV